MARQMKRANRRNTNVPAAAPANTPVMQQDKFAVANRTKEEILKQRFEEANEAFRRLRDYQKNSTRTISPADKSAMRTYISNYTSNENNLRNISWYLFYRSQVYSRVVLYYANMFYLDAHSVIPNQDITKSVNANKTLKTFYNACKEVDKLRLQGEFYPILVTAFLQDASYNIIMEDDDSVFIMPLPAENCRIIGKYPQTGELAFSLDATWLRSHQELIEYYPDVFQKLWNNYNSTREKWQPIPEEYSLCIKYRTEDLETVMPPFLGSLLGFVDIADMQDNAAEAAEQALYKLIWLEMKTIQGSDSVDDWQIDPSLSVAYFNKMLEEAIPANISGAMVPGELHEISFPDNTATEVNKAQKAMEVVLNTTGGAQVLNGSQINNTLAIKYSGIADTEYAISSILPQIEGWVNHRLLINGIQDCWVKFYPISSYTREDFKKEILESCQNGAPNILLYNSLNGVSELQTLSMLNIQNDILHLTEKFIPLKTSYTQSGDEDTDPVNGGRPPADDSELTQEGSNTRNYQ